MAEIKAEAYQDLRDYIQNNWKYIELRDDTSTAVMRIDTSDSRVSWTHSSGAQTLELTAVLTGSDSDITLPQTFAESAIYDVASDGNAYSVETFSAFTMENDSDELTVKHQIEVPEVV